MCKVDSLCYCLFAVGGGPLHPPIPLDGVLALSIFLPSSNNVYTTHRTPSTGNTTSDGHRKETLHLVNLDSSISIPLILNPLVSALPV